MGDAVYTFLPWLRTGLSALLTTRDNVASAAGRASLPVSLAVNSKNTPTVPVGVFGPGDVASLDPRQVIRCEPSANTAAFEPNYFPCVEFARPDLPWMFTPTTAAAADGTLRPWLVLVVVRVQDGVEFVRQDDRLSTLEIKAPAKPGDELPDLAESWAWAHVQIAGAASGSTEIAALMRDQPERIVSRLLCSRRLDARTRYRACLVPAFEAGVKAGLGEELAAADLATLKPAWASGASAPDRVRLPVYYTWQFATGADGDFESIVRALTARELPATVGTAPFDVGHPGAGLPESNAAVVGFTGVLTSAPPKAGQTPPPDSRFTAWPETHRAACRDALAAMINASKDAAADPDPVVAPPIYGRWHAATPRVSTTAGATPVWLNELNLDPRYRAVAGLGAKVVRSQQDALMAAAWEQIGAVKAANELLRRSQLAREVGSRLKSKHFDKMSAAAKMQFSRGAHRRLGEGGATVFGALAGSSMPRGAVSAGMRKVGRPGSSATRRAPRGTAPRSAGAVDKIASGKANVGAAFRATPGAATLDQVKSPTTAAQPSAIAAAKLFAMTSDRFTAVLADTLKKSAITLAPGAASRVGVPGVAGAGLPGRSVIASRPFTSAAKTSLAQLADPLKALQKGLARFSADRRVTARPALDLAKVAALVARRLDAPAGVLAHVRARVKAPASAWTRTDPLDVIMAAPEFPQPMYAALRTIAPDWFCPGLDQMPDETIGLLKTNAAVVAAYMVGLNHEMARELLWREYPTDQRGTYFRQFWDPAGRVPAPVTASDIEAAKDIPAIHGWSDRGALGSHLTGAAKSGDLLVLLIRGSLLRRYPDASIYAVKAAWNNGVREPATTDGVEQQIFPLFSGALPPDIGFFGFPLKGPAARGNPDPTVKDPGYFFVVQQQPTAPRFGLDIAVTYGGRPTAWSAASWGHLAPSASALGALKHVPVGGPLANLGIGGTTWGKNAAHFANITLQQPVRIFVHADALLLDSWE